MEQDEWYPPAGPTTLPPLQAPHPQARTVGQQGVGKSVLSQARSLAGRQLCLSRRPHQAVAAVQEGVVGLQVLPGGQWEGSRRRDEAGEV